MAIADHPNRSQTSSSGTTKTAAGRDVLRDPQLNHGTAFTPEERSALGLEGLLPPGVLSLEEQARRSYEQYRAQPTDLAKNDFLAALHDRNEVLYYKLLGDHLTEMLPVVYDPVVAQAIERYSHEFQRPNGVYLSIDDIDGVETAFHNYGLGADDVDLLVATDAEEILGIGDWGSNGMDISIGKLAVYTAAAGIDPDRVIPVMLDVGTDRESLLNDPMYVGNRHSRVRGERYDALIKAYVEAASRLFPNALLHFEDFGPSNARRILNRVPGPRPDLQRRHAGNRRDHARRDPGRDACRRFARERAASGDLRCRHGRGRDRRPDPGRDDRRRLERRGSDEAVLVRR